MTPPHGIQRIEQLVATARERSLEVNTGKPVNDAWLDQISSIMEMRFPEPLREYFRTFGFLQVEDLKVAGFSATKGGAKDTFPIVGEDARRPGEGYLPVYGDRDEYVWVCCRAGSDDFGRVWSGPEDDFVAPDFISWLAEKLGLLLDSYAEGPPPLPPLE
ncbi:MAG: hypothetical protein AB7K09_22235 [Planctomycetota bacterium]